VLVALLGQECRVLVQLFLPSHLPVVGMEPITLSQEQKQAAVAGLEEGLEAQQQALETHQILLQAKEITVEQV
jgi:hypothetical protein